MLRESDWQLRPQTIRDDSRYSICTLLSTSSRLLETHSNFIMVSSLVTAAAGFLLAVLFLWMNLPGWLYAYYKKLQASRQLRGRPMHWFWGNLSQVGPYDWAVKEWMKWVQEKRGKVFRVWMGPTYMVAVLHHPDSIKKVIKEPKNMDVYHLLTPWLGDGLLISADKKWFRNRRLLTPAFHYEILKPYIPVYNTCLQMMLTKWSTSAKENNPVKLFETVGLLSLDILLQCSFSYKSDCQNIKTRHPYIRAVYVILELVTHRFLTPLHHSDWIYWLTSSGKQMKENCILVHEFSERVIRERKTALGLDGPGADRDAALEIASKQRKYLDFLDILLTAADQDGKGLSDLEIRDEADTFMFEGHDTTTSGMCWTLYCLAKHPEHQEKVREEVKSVLMGRELLEYEDLKDLKYTHWCIKEAMRLYPPVYEVYRQLSKDTEIDGVVIPKDTKVTISVRAVHRHPDIWQNPNEFDPLRFHPSNAEGRDPYAYMPFSAGYRNCIGQNFALNEEKVVIATIVSRFRLALVPDHEVKERPTGILKTQNDILLTLQPPNME